SKAQNPELKKYLDKRVSIQLNGKRRISGVLRGFDPFMNVVLDEAVEILRPDQQQQQQQRMGMIVVRGNSVVILECLDRI
ncbi:hypothetical protein BOX15_Mlig022716g1, partial [Macrostomum lignano]